MGTMAHSHEPEELPPIVAERRVPRRKALLGGLTVSRDGARLVECAIREISTSGARIRIAKGDAIPSNVYLIVSGKDLVHEAVIVWVGSQDIGLKFLKTYQSGDLTEPEMQSLRRLVVDRLPRTGTDFLNSDRRRDLPPDRRRADPTPPR